MNAIFFASASLMLLLAMFFATAPLLRNARTSSGGFVYVPLLAVLAVILLATGLYAVIGRPDVVASASVKQTSPVGLAQATPASAGKKAVSVSDLLAGLEASLEKDPDDAKGWLLLAKSYNHLGRYRDAAAAYERASALGLSDSALEASLR